MVKQALWWSSVLTLGMVACGGDADDSSGAPALALEDVPVAYAEAFCSAFRRCNPFFKAVMPESACETFFTSTLENQGFADIEDAIEDGRATYDGHQMRNCIDTVGSRACDQFDDPDPESCDLAAQGTVARGEECTTNIECEGDSVCSFENGCPGTCSAKLNAGDICSGDDQCDEGLECADDTGRCVEPAGEGDDCEGGVAPECAGENLYCLGDDVETGTAGTCRSVEDVFVGEPGDPCNLDEGPLCMDGAACVVSEITLEGATFICAAVAEGGDDCKLGVPNSCEPGYHCAGTSLATLDFEGTCQATLDAGEECDVAGAGVLACGFGAACVADTAGVGHCVARKNNGVSCTVDAECWSENCLSGGCAPTNACTE